MKKKNDSNTRSFFPNKFDYFSLSTTSKLLPILAWMGMFAVDCPAQPIPRETLLEDLLEYRLEQNDEPSGQEYTTPEPEDLLPERCIDLNNATPSDLELLFMWSEIQKNALIRHIERHGPLLSIFELQAIPELNAEAIRAALPVVCVKRRLDQSKLNWKDLLLKGKHRLLIRTGRTLQLARAYKDTTNNRFLGSPFQLYTGFRYRFHNTISYGFLGEKDAGEQLFGGSNRMGFDHYSAHFFYRGKGVLHLLALGDYDVKLGQGLIAWSGFGFGKGSNVMAVKKSGSPLRPYTSVDENRYKRGLGLTLDLGSMKCTGFLSYAKRDANVIQRDSVTSKPVVISALLRSGLHRDGNELMDKKAVGEWIAGGNISFQLRHLQFGANAIYTRYRAILDRNLNLYNRFEFEGTSLANISIDYSLPVRGLLAFGEFALSDNLGYGFINGLLLSMDHKADLSLVHRYYGRNFQTLHANAFGENSRPSNEHGIFLGLALNPVPYVRINFYADLYRHPWLSFRVDAPSSGQEFMLKASFSPSKKLELYGRFTWETESINHRMAGSKSSFPEDRSKWNQRLHIAIKATENLTLSSRLEVNGCRRDSDAQTIRGVQFYQDASFLPLSSPFSFTVRYALFSSPTNDVKVYAYENDFSTAASFASFIGSGSRFYCSIRLKASRHLDLRARFSRTSFPGSSVITASSSRSSNPGRNAIDSDHIDEVKMQVVVRF